MIGVAFRTMAVFLSLVAIALLCGMLITANLNPMEWTPKVRSACVGIPAVISFYYFMGECGQ